MRSCKHRGTDKVSTAALKLSVGLPLTVKLFLTVLAMAAVNVAVSPKIFCQDSLCVHFAGDHKGLHIELNGEYSMNGVVPLTVCDLRPGETWDLVVNGLGLETRRGCFRLGEDGIPVIAGNRFSTMLRNCLLPGWGSIKAGRKAAGLTDMGLVAASAAYYSIEELEYRDMKEKYDKLCADILEVSSAEDREALQEAVYAGAKALNVQNTQRKRALYLTAAAYGYQLLDPILSGNPPGWSADAGGSIVRIDASERSTIKAFLYSTIWPGRGQLYQGKKIRGVLFPIISAAAGVYALDRMNSTDEYSMLYELEVEKWRGAVSLEDRTYHGTRASSIWEDLEETRHERNTALIIFAGVWGLNMIDTFFESEEYVPSPGLTMEFSPAGMAFVMKF